MSAAVALDIRRVGPVVYSLDVDEQGNALSAWAICDNCGSLPPFDMTYIFDPLWLGVEPDVRIDPASIPEHVCAVTR